MYYLRDESINTRRDEGTGRERERGRENKGRANDKKSEGEQKGKRERKSELRKLTAIVLETEKEKISHFCETATVCCFVLGKETKSTTSVQVREGTDTHCFKVPTGRGGPLQRRHLDSTSERFQSRSLVPRRSSLVPRYLLSLHPEGEIQSFFYDRSYKHLASGDRPLSRLLKHETTAHPDPRHEDQTSAVTGHPLEAFGLHCLLQLALEQFCCVDPHSGRLSLR